MNKIVIMSLLTMTSMNAFANTANLYYTNGPDKGKDLTVKTTYFGSYNICFTGDSSAAEKLITKLLENDGEKTSTFAKYTAHKKVVVYGYVDTKCTDEGASDQECRVVKFAGRCQ